MNFLWWTLICVIIATAISEVGGDSTAYPVIPDHLLECYMDDGLYHRANRVPASFESFIDLLRKVETGPTSRNLNARELAMALLHYLKLDGIQSIRSHTNYFPSNILPFAPSGSEYFKHRLTLVGLVPRIDQSYMTTFNETLTKKEMCNLHFMLSYSIDPYKRDDEKCSPLYEESKKKTAPSSEWDLYQSGRGYQRRYRRGIDQRNDFKQVSTLNDKNPRSRKSLRKREIEQTENMLKKQALENPQKGSKPLSGDGVKEIRDLEKLLRRIKRSSEDKNPDVEVLHPGVQKTEKSKFTIGDQELLSGSEYGSKKGLRQSLIQMGTFGRGSYPRPMQSLDEGGFSGVIPGIPLSECPVVNGIITTSFGSLTIGTVIAGIAAGLNPEEIYPTKLSVDPKELEPGDRVKNIWATTLAGTIADTITSSALLHADSFQILKGGWNDTNNPHWYLLATNQFQHLPEVTIRGSLDGLLLGLSAKEWTNRFPSFKLSQMLQTYYDYLWGKVGAKNRVQLMSEQGREDTLRGQVHLMSLVLKKQKTNVLTVLDFSHIAREATTKVTQYIQTMDEKSYIGSFLSTKIDNAVNMIAVIDSSWGHNNLATIFQELRAAGVASTLGSNLTIVCGNDGRILATAENSIDIHSLFTKDALQENCTRGMNLPLVFDTLDVMYRKVYNDERTRQKMNVDALVAVLFPFDSLLQENANYVIEKSWNFMRSFPDVRLMIAANGRADSYQQMVNNAKDIFTLSAYTPVAIQGVDKFADGVKQSYQRITRPSCGSYFDDDTAGEEVRVIKDVNPGNIVYYRLAPNYFYTQHGEAVVTIRSKLRVPLTVCHSREMDRPAGPSPREAPNRYPDRNNLNPNFPPEASLYGRQTDQDGSVECKTITSEPYKIVLNNPCQGASGLKECLPLYISLTAPIQDGETVPCPNCRLPIGVQYEISATGLTCYNSAAAVLMSPLLFFLVVIRHFLIN